MVTVGRVFRQQAARPVTLEEVATAPVGTLLVPRDEAIAWRKTSLSKSGWVRQKPTASSLDGWGPSGRSEDSGQRVFLDIVKFLRKEALYDITPRHQNPQLPSGFEGFDFFGGKEPAEPVVIPSETEAKIQVERHLGACPTPHGVPHAMAALRAPRLRGATPCSLLKQVDREASLRRLAQAIPSGKRRKVTVYRKPSRLASRPKTSHRKSNPSRRNGDAPFLVGDRVELHPATDRWMRGDRYGEVVYVNAKKGTATVLLDKSGKRLRFRFENLMSTDRQARLEGREVGHRNNSRAKKMGGQKEKPFLAVEEGAGTLRWPDDKPLPTGLDKDGNRRFDIETRGPWGTASKVTGLAVEKTSEGFLVYGDRSLGSPRESGYQMEGTVSIGGVKRSAFTSSHLFIHRDPVTGQDVLHDFAVLYIRGAGHRNNPEPRWRERLIEKVREDKQRGAITSGEYSDLIEEIQRAKSQSKAEEIVSAHRRMRAWNPGGATGKQRVFAKSEYRYRASASERRLRGGSTVTQFLVGLEGSEPSTWMRVMGYGPTPGERKTYAIKKFLGSQDDPAKEIKKINKGRGRKSSPFRRGR